MFGKTIFLVYEVRSCDGKDIEIDFIMQSLEEYNHPRHLLLK